jgi:hypothetical protein
VGSQEFNVKGLPGLWVAGDVAAPTFSFFSRYDMRGCLKALNEFAPKGESELQFKQKAEVGVLSKIYALDKILVAEGKLGLRDPMELKSEIEKYNPITLGGILLLFKIKERIEKEGVDWKAPEWLR